MNTALIKEIKTLSQYPRSLSPTEWWQVWRGVWHNRFKLGLNSLTCRELLDTLRSLYKKQPYAGYYVWVAR